MCINAKECVSRQEKNGVHDWNGAEMRGNILYLHPTKYIFVIKTHFCSAFSKQKYGGLKVSKNKQWKKNVNIRNSNTSFSSLINV